MKHIYKLLPVLMIVFFSGCTKQFEKINTDPNQVTLNNYNPLYNLTQAELEYTGNSDFSYETWRVNIIYCGMMMQQLANASWYAGDKYIANQSWAQAYWDVAYPSQVKYVVDLMQIIKGKPQYANLYQIARILKVMIFHRLTDIYGDIPYFQAGLGYYDRIFAPKYDRQQDIYKDMLNELDQAAQALDPNKDQPGTADLIFRGASNSIQLWKKLAYSLMVRLAMRLAKVDAVTAQNYVQKAVAGGTMASNADNAYILGDATGGRNTVNRNSNILAGEWNATGNGEVFLSKTLIDYLESTNDPRLPFVSKVKSTGSTSPSDQVGLPNGYDQNGGATDVSHAPGYNGSINNFSTIRGDIMLKLNGPTFLVTYDQTELLLAEAAQRGWNAGASAATHYNNAITGAMQQLTQYDASAVVSNTAITAYLAANPYNGTYLQINNQYWVACYENLDWYEAWANWRRSGYPVLVPVNYPGNATNGQIPRRMLYPASEASANGANYQQAITNQGPNTFMTKVWWDK